MDRLTSGLRREGPGTEPRVGSAAKHLLPWFACFGGLLFHFQPFWWSGFRLTHHGLGDGRLVNFTLEHGHRWLRQVEPHLDFWRPPIFFPYDRASAFTDVLLGVAPPYWLARSLGAAPDTALQVWVLVIHCVNFAAAYWLLRSGSRLGVWPATAGATLLAAMSQVWTSHLQLYCFGYVLIGMLALFRVFDQRQTAPGPGRRRGWIAVFYVCAILQLWTAVYPFFFFGLLAVLGALVALMVPRLRTQFIDRVRADAFVWLGMAVVAAILVAPLLIQYLQTASELGFREYHRDALPTPTSWVSIGPRDHLARRVASPIPPAPVPWGVGTVVGLTGAVGLILGRRRGSVVVLAGASLLLFVLGTNWFGSSLWQWVHEWIPGAGGIRAPARLPMAWVPAVVLGVALFVQWAMQQRRTVLASGVVLLCLLERAHVLGVIDKQAVRQHVSGLAARVDTGQDAFLLVGIGSQGRWIPDDAAWVALATGVPAVNGRYGNRPEGYELDRDLQIEPADAGARARVESALRAWLSSNGVEREQVQWLEYRPLTQAPKARDEFVRRGPFVFRRAPHRDS